MKNRKKPAWKKHLEAARRFEGMVKEQKQEFQDQAIEAERRLKRANEETQQQARIVADLRTSQARSLEEIDRLKKDVAAAQAERDRLLSVTDRFLSVQIVGHGQVLQPHTVGAQQPGTLRRF